MTNIYNLPANIHLTDGFRLAKDEMDDYLQEDVTSSTEIKIYLDQARCSDDYTGRKLKKIYKIYRCSAGFTVGKICILILKTYWDAIEEILNGDYIYIDNLSLASFAFDPETNSVYPDTDS